MEFSNRPVKKGLPIQGLSRSGDQNTQSNLAPSLNYLLSNLFWFDLSVREFLN